MRRIILTISIITGIILSSCTNQKTDNSFNLTLNIKNGENNAIYLSKRENGTMVYKDSVQLVNGKGFITGNIDLPEFYYLTIKGTRVYIPVFIEKGDIFVDADVSDPRHPLVSGSISNEIYDAYNDSVKVFDNKSSELYLKYNEAKEVNDSVLMNEIEEEYYKIDSLKSNYLVGFIIDNADNTVGAFLLNSNTYKFELKELDSIIAVFDPKIDSSIYVKTLKSFVQTLKKSAVGQPFIDFTMADPTGNSIALSSVAGNGNYVLVDFWASWCSPCRAENPNVVEAFNKYHDKGFDVYGVSFDQDHEKWVDAIIKDDLTWTHVSDLKGWGCEAGKIYGIQSIPQNILIDPDGIIIEKNLRGEDLQNKLADIFN